MTKSGALGVLGDRRSKGRVCLSEELLGGFSCSCPAPKDGGGAATPSGLPVRSSLDPCGIIDLKEGQGECSRNQATAWRRGSFSWCG